MNARRRASVSPWPIVGMAGMAGMAAAFLLYAASGLLAPWWGVALLMAIWLALFVQACLWWTPHPGRVPLLAVAAVVLWFLVLTAGDAWLGWTA